jgi:hypothetical protein
VLDIRARTISLIEGDNNPSTSSFSSLNNGTDNDTSNASPSAVEWFQMLSSIQIERDCQDVAGSKSTEPELSDTFSQGDTVDISEYTHYFRLVPPTPPLNTRTSSINLPLAHPQDSPHSHKARHALCQGFPLNGKPRKRAFALLGGIDRAGKMANISVASNRIPFPRIEDPAASLSLNMLNHVRDMSVVIHSVAALPLCRLFLG